MFIFFQGSMNQMVDRKTNSYRIQKPSAAIVKGLRQAIMLFNFDAFLLLPWVIQLRMDIGNFRMDAQCIALDRVFPDDIPGS